MADYTSNISIVNRYGMTILIIFSILETVFHFSFENIFGCCVAIYAWWLSSKYIFTLNNLQKFLLPTMAVWGYTLMYYFLPVIVTFVEGKPLTFNFSVPIELFINQFININAMFLAFTLCKRYYRQNNFFSRLWRKMGYFTVPNNRQIWALGIIGLVALIYNVITQQVQASFDEMNEVAEGGFLHSLIKFSQSFMIAPLFLFYKKHYGAKDEKVKKYPIVFFFIIVSIIAMATTRRSFILLPLLSICVISLINLFLQNKKIFTPKKIILLSLSIWFIGGPLTDISIAMALSRHDIEGAKTFDLVVKRLQNREDMYYNFQAIQLASDNKGNNNLGWSEYYVDNLFLDRFCNLRVQDETIFLAKKIGYNNKHMHDFVFDKILLHIPTSVVNALGFNKRFRSTPVDLMNELTTRSKMGDMFWNRVSGDMGSGLFWLGYWYYPVAVIILFLTFCFFCTLTRPIKDASIFIVSIPVLITFESYLTYFVNAHGIVSSISLLERVGVERIVLYCFLMWILRKFIR